ncbi:hypothetical protein CDL15_Pgr022911 [Punica granatum]|uniref:Uncharacterized protein n=1 Tax=Punica granatum TaxID=22663 RepID=A0A218X464_PUNGR|nr:hypothetical protein CDL15_Pgr022911 [Punica granatum]PKI35774.1 hypothetical protein CRG98_043809 [Punica granatum]
MAGAKNNSDAVHPEVHHENEDECRTPMSKENRIPVVLTCPPAPKRSRDLTLAWKRKLLEQEVLEILNYGRGFSSGIDEDRIHLGAREVKPKLGSKKLM